MKKVFADTLYWMAIASHQDQWHRAAVSAKRSLRDVVLVTTDEVLSEFLNAFSRTASLRRGAVLTIRRIFSDPDVEIVPQTRDGFLQALNRFDRRPDKKYSLVDCHSMNVMEAEGIEDVLTNDHHFEQEGFNVLIRR